MKNKIRVGLLFGGRSAEHEISLLSARNVYEAIDKEKFEVVLIGIDKEGTWCLQNEAVLLLESDTGALPALEKAQEPVTLTPYRGRENLVPLAGSSGRDSIDVIFPILHGPLGEDGTVQGLLTLADLPFVGPGVLGSAVAMDKDVMNRLLREAGVPIGGFHAYTAPEKESLSFDEVVKQLGAPLFVKPANLGSSVGVSKVHNEEEFRRAVDEAFQFDNKILIEEFVDGRELECAVLGNEAPKASAVGEIVSAAKHGFYSYDAKYVDDAGADVIIPSAF